MIKIIILVNFILFTISTAEAKKYILKDNLFTSSNIIVSKDPTSFKELNFIEYKKIKFWDRRREQQGPVYFDAFIFIANFEKGNSIEIRVNEEFGSLNEAKNNAEKYSKIVGQLPNFLRTKNLKTITIHKGKKPWGGGNNDILIHTEMYSKDLSEFVEEVAMHEAAHTSLDYQWDGLVIESEWKKAQKLDKKFISKYAKRFSKREDVAETINWWIAVKCKKERISNSLFQNIIYGIPNRLKYLDSLKFDTYPLNC